MGSPCYWCVHFFFCTILTDRYWVAKACVFQQQLSSQVLFFLPLQEYQVYAVWFHCHCWSRKFVPKATPILWASINSLNMYPILQFVLLTWLSASTFVVFYLFLHCPSYIILSGGGCRILSWFGSFASSSCQLPGSATGCLLSVASSLPPMLSCPVKLLYLVAILGITPQCAPYCLVYVLPSCAMCCVVGVFIPCLNSWCRNPSHAFFWCFPSGS